MLNIIFKILLFLAPSPIFIDAANSNIFIYFVPNGDITSLYSAKPEIPIPIVFFVAFILFTVGIIGVLVNKIDISLICKSCFYIMSLFVLLISIIFILFGVNVTSIVQVLMGFLLISAIPLFLNINTLNSIANSYFFGMLFWLTLHTLSILIQNDYSLIGVDRNWNYSTIFGVLIYQSQVSYSATLSVFTIFSVFMYLEKSFRILALTTFSMAVFIGFVSQTRLFFLDYIIITIFLVLYKYPYLKIFSINMRKTIVVIISLLLLITGYLYYGNRIVLGASDRFGLMYQGIEKIMQNPSLFIWGEGLIHSFAHNFFIDFVLNYGLVFLIILLVVLIFNLCFTIRLLRLSRNGFVFLGMIATISLTNSIFNSAITQPLFVGNVYVTLIIIVSYLMRISQMKLPFNGIEGSFFVVKR